MRLPRFRSRNKADARSTSDASIFDEAVELAQLRLEECMAALHDRNRKPEQELDRAEPLATDESQKAVA